MTDYKEMSFNELVERAKGQDSVLKGLEKLADRTSKLGIEANKLALDLYAFCGSDFREVDQTPEDRMTRTVKLAPKDKEPKARKPTTATKEQVDKVMDVLAAYPHSAMTLKEIRKEIAGSLSSKVVGAALRQLTQDGEAINQPTDKWQAAPAYVPTNNRTTPVPTPIEARTPEEEMSDGE